MCGHADRAMVYRSGVVRRESLHTMFSAFGPAIARVPSAEGRAAGRTEAGRRRDTDTLGTTREKPAEMGAVREILAFCSRQSTMRSDAARGGSTGRRRGNAPRPHELNPGMTT